MAKSWFEFILEFWSKMHNIDYYLKRTLEGNVKNYEFGVSTSAGDEVLTKFISFPMGDVTTRLIEEREGKRFLHGIYNVDSVDSEVKGLADQVQIQDFLFRLEQIKLNGERD